LTSQTATASWGIRAARAARPPPRGEEPSGGEVRREPEAEALPPDPLDLVRAARRRLGRLSGSNPGAAIQGGVNVGRGRSEEGRRRSPMITGPETAPPPSDAASQAPARLKRSGRRSWPP
jgi:hypothetical protein